ncbi:MAG: hypothetical protein ACR2LN_08335 [Candidatus Levyibacteriota bacterium]
MARERANDGTGREWISGRDMDDFFRKIKGYQEKKNREQKEAQSPLIPLHPSRPISQEVFVEPSRNVQGGVRPLHQRTPGEKGN